MNKTNIGIIILAAGASTRMGSPKQLVRFKGKTLIERIINISLSTGFETLVVLGANAEEIGKSIENMQVGVLLHSEWERGLSSSIQKGLERLLVLNTDLSAVILLLGDQPFVTKETILRLVETQTETGKLIISSEYADTFGTPALFDREVFRELLALTGDGGAKGLISDNMSEKVSFVAAPEAAIDIDTKEDLAQLTGA